MDNPKKVKLHDKTFKVMIPEVELDRDISAVAARINADYADTDTPPLFLGVLNGAFMFMSELMQKIEFNCELSFVKLASYSGLNSTGKVSELIGLKNNIEGKHVIIVEDIVDSGESMEHLLRSLAGHSPASVEIVTMFFKPAAFKKDYPVKYIAREIGNEFIVGFGLDYDELGRNLKDIYVLSSDE
jgi:hypoxanthine phosphoribosyltransferase